MKFVVDILKNPLTMWLKWLLKKWSIQLKFKGNNLSIGYMTHCNNCNFGKYNVIHSQVLLSNVSIADCSYISSNSVIQNTIIGKFCSIGPNVRSGVGNHLKQEYISTHPAFFTNSEICNPVISFVDKTYFEFLKPIAIGNDVWIGANVIILDGVKIGDGAIIGAGAIVTKDIPPYAIAVGVPAKIIKYRFTQNHIEMLLNSQWWNKDVEWLKNNSDIFRNVEKFIGNMSKQTN